MIRDRLGIGSRPPESESIDRASSWWPTWIAVNRLWRTATAARRRGDRWIRTRLARGGERLARGGGVQIGAVDRPARLTRGAAELEQVARLDGVEGLDDGGVGQMVGDPAARGRARLDLRDLAVAAGVVVARVDHELAGQLGHRQLRDRLERDRDDREIGALHGGRRLRRRRPRLARQALERLRAAGVRDRDLMTECRQPPGERRADVARSDDADVHVTEPNVDPPRRPAAEARSVG